MPALKSLLSDYVHSDLSYKDVSKLATPYPDLKPGKDKFMYNDGTTRNLVRLVGTIPVLYRSSRYNIPIELWLQPTHPYTAPICYVKPTSDMLVKASPQVDSNGKVYLPYLTEWKFPQSDLYTLVQILSLTFGEDCPVYKKPANMPYAAPAPYAPPPQPGYPPGIGGPPAGYTPMPTLPARGFPSYPTARPPYQPPALNTPYGPSRPAYNAAYGYPAPTRPPVPPFPPAGQGQYQQTGYPDAAVRASLVSAVDEKLKRRLKQTIAQADAEIESLKKCQNDLQRGSQRLENIITSLEKDNDDIERHFIVLKQKNGDIVKTIDEVENKVDDSETDVDEAVQPTTPLYHQMLNLFASENAIEDTLYYLGDALKMGLVELEIYLKQVRTLSRKQFELRALIFKARQKAGLRC